MAHENLDLPSLVAIDFMKWVIAQNGDQAAKGMPVVFSDEPDPWPFVAPRDSQWTDWPGAGNDGRPTAELTAAFVAQGGESALRGCRSVRSFLTDQHLPFGPGAVKRARFPDGGRTQAPLFAGTIVRLTVPVVSGDGSEALLSSASENGINMASGDYYYLRPGNDGAWAVRSVSRSWIA